VLEATDLQLVAAGVVIGAASVALLAPVWGRRVASPAFVLALGICVAIDPEGGGALPASVDVPVGHLAVGVAAALAAAAAARRGDAARVPSAVLAAGMASAGVYLAVPETSYALLGGGCLAGAALALVLTAPEPTRGFLAAVSAAPALAATLGAAGRSVALAGGLLACVPIVVIAAAPGALRGARGVLVGGAALGASVAAARLVAGEPSFGAAVPGLLAVGALVVAAVVLARAAQS
jgi:hypothetical protein